MHASGQPHSAILALAALAFLAVGCYSLSEPSLRPGNSRDIVGALARQGATIGSALAGDSACDDPGLVGNALRVTASMPSDPEPRDIYIYSFRLRSWEESEAAVDACQAEFTAANPAAHMTRLDVPTYRAFGADWSEEMADSVRGALEEASQAG